MMIRMRKQVSLFGAVLLLGGLACQSTWQLPTANEALPALETMDAVEGDAAFAETIFSTDLQSQQDAMVALYKQVRDGVVSVLTHTNLGITRGTGFVIDLDGHILTNYHVINHANTVEILFATGLRAEAQVIGFDADTDLAVLKVSVPTSRLQPLTLGDSSNVEIGQIVIAIGNPYGLTGSMSTGIVSSMGRSFSSFAPPATLSAQLYSAGDLIQTDAAINPGNSGGPLLNLNGEVIGVNRAIRTFNYNDDGDFLNSGIGFAVAIDIVKQVVPYLIEDGHFDYPYLGLTGAEELTLTEAARLGLNRTTGVYVIEVDRGGPAERVGIQEGDLIINLEGRNINSYEDLVALLFANYRPGDVIRLQILRGNNEFPVDVELGTRP